MTTGTCNCGAIQFEIHTSPSEIIICHCSICRRSTGSNGIAVVIVRRDDFRWTQGEDAIGHWQKPDADWRTSFCKNCGSPLPGANNDTHLYVPAGLIAEGDKPLKVAHHIWVASKARWDRIGDDGVQHPHAYSS